MCVTEAVAERTCVDIEKLITLMPDIREIILLRQINLFAMLVLISCMKH